LASGTTVRFGFAQLGITREGCCPPFSASNKSEEDWSACLIYITATKTVQLCFLFEILAEYSDAE
jgi:hypothetical protein